ncbi:MAG: hypothetical protein AB1898_14570 [Acidobacteriota bacterium]
MINFRPSNLPQKIERIFQPKLPPVACEVSPEHFCVVRIGNRRPPTLERFSAVPLPAGLFVPSLIRPCISSFDEFENLVRTTLAKADLKPARISLAIPDAVAKVAVQALDTLPGKEGDRAQLLRWKLKKSVPFNIDEGSLAWREQRTPQGKYLTVTAGIAREVLSQIERVFQNLGIHVGYVTLSSFASFELLVRSDAQALQGSVLYIRTSPSSISSLIFQNGNLVFFRTSELDGAPEGPSRPATPAAAYVDRLYDEIHPCLMYYQDKIGAQGIERVYVSPHIDLERGSLAVLSEKASCPVHPVDISQAVHWPAGEARGAIRAALLSPLGLALGKF